MVALGALPAGSAVAAVVVGRRAGAAPSATTAAGAGVVLLGVASLAAVTAIT